MAGFQKNVSGQKWLVKAFYDSGGATPGAPVTGEAPNITAKIRKDYGSATATNDLNPVAIEDGFYEFDLTQAETNADVIDILPESSTSNVQVVGVPGRVFTEAPSYNAKAVNDLNDPTANDIRDAITGGAYSLDTDSNGRIRLVVGTASGEISLSSGEVPSSNMRGTDSAYTGTPPTAGAIADAVHNESRNGTTLAEVLGWFVDLTEDDGGTQRFTANALEEAPSGSGTSPFDSGDAEQIRYRLQTDGTQTAPATDAPTQLPVDVQTVNQDSVTLATLTDATVYYADIDLISDDKNSQDEYTVILYTNGEEADAADVSSPQLEVIRPDGTNLIGPSSLTQIGSTNYYKYTATAANDERITPGQGYTARATWTQNGGPRTWSEPISRDFT